MKADKFANFEEYWQSTFNGMSGEEIIKYKDIGRESAKQAYEYQQKRIRELERTIETYEHETETIKEMKAKYDSLLSMTEKLASVARELEGVAYHSTTCETMSDFNDDDCSCGREDAVTELDVFIADFEKWKKEQG